MNFAHADDHAGTKFQTCAAADIQRLQTVLERMSRTDLFVKSLAGIQIVVHSIHTCRLQLQRLIGLQQTQAAADVQTISVFDLTDDIGHMIDFTIGGPAAAGNDAIRTSFAFRGLASPIHQAFGIQERVLFDRRFGDL